MSTDPDRYASLEEFMRLEQELLNGIRSHWPNDTEINGYKLVCTCGACPEQYDVFDASGAQVGYLRLRHGRFRADYPDCGGETVYESYTKGDGVFDESERVEELTKAINALAERISKNAVL